MYVCICHSVTDRQIREAVDQGAASLEDLGETLALGTSCGKCLDCASEVLADALRTCEDPHLALPSFA
jgi:bacterioferritin-associated ferredoxin